MRQGLVSRGVASLGWTLLFSAAVLAEPPAPQENLLTRSKAVQFEIVLGRITMTHVRLGQNRSQASGDKESQRTETLLIGMQHQTPTFRYEQVVPERKVTIEVLPTGEFVAQQIPTQPSSLAEIVFRQKNSGETRLLVSENGMQTEFVARSLWHLMLEHPTIGREKCAPLLNILGSQWQIADDVEEIRELLLRRATAGLLPDFHRVNDLVRQLSHKEFARRQAADRELRAMGCAIVAHLQSMDTTVLDSEQRQRLRAIVAAAKAPKADTPERVASWLTADPAVWLILASDIDHLPRQIAAEQLQRLVARTIDFQPYEEESVRKEQLVRLRKQLRIE